MNQDKLSKLRAIFAAFLEDARRSKGLTREQVAQRLQVTEDLIEEWECGDRLIDLIELRAYCQAIGLPVKDAVVFLEAISDRLSPLES